MESEDLIMERACRTAASYRAKVPGLIEFMNVTPCKEGYIAIDRKFNEALVERATSLEEIMGTDCVVHHVQEDIFEMRQTQDEGARETLEVSDFFYGCDKIDFSAIAWLNPSHVNAAINSEGGLNLYVEKPIEPQSWLESWIYDPPEKKGFILSIMPSEDDVHLPFQEQLLLLDESIIWA